MKGSLDPPPQRLETPRLRTAAVGNGPTVCLPCNKLNFPLCAFLTTHDNKNNICSLLQIQSIQKYMKKLDTG